MVRVVLWIAMVLGLLVCGVHSTAISVSREESIGNFLSLYDHYHDTCSDPEVNKVLTRGDRINTNYSISRPWSLDAGAIHTLLQLNMRDGQPIKSRLRSCHSLEDVLHTIAQPIDRQTCLLTWFSPSEVCSLMTQFSFVWLQGDSLTRHLSQALLILMRGDLRYGGIGRPTEEHLSSCQCDGQFSESLLCRQAYFPSFVHFNKKFLKNMNACAHTSLMESEESHDTVFMDNKAGIVDVSLRCGGDDERPIVVFLQGGLHYKTNSTRAIVEFLEPNMNHFLSSLESCLERTRFIFSGSIVVSPELEKRYTHERRARSREYNHNMTRYISKHFPFVHIMDFWNMTLHSTNRTSDGMHSLTDMNLIKATALLNVLNQLQ